MIHSIRKSAIGVRQNIETDAIPQGSDKASRMPNAHRYRSYSGGCPMTVLRLSYKASVPTRFPSSTKSCPAARMPVHLWSFSELFSPRTLPTSIMSSWTLSSLTSLQSAAIFFFLVAGLTITSTSGSRNVCTESLPMSGLY